MFESWKGQYNVGGGHETNPLLAALKSFLTAFVKFWSDSEKVEHGVSTNLGLHAKSGVQKPGHKVNFPDDREEGSNAIDELLVATKVNVKQHIKILVPNCSGDQPLQAET
ncbi:hypothetical protein HID58_014482 [Brassica napus]|uniref:Uncharacterized protein n=1 Tax=Brassica napus TaxID=3708 RepID=A0ABQ8DH96_BRANA|nr:hypothetical protein HID58_014482 [Brassica napus]